MLRSSRTRVFSQDREAKAWWSRVLSQLDSVRASSTLEFLWNVVLSLNLVLAVCFGSRDGIDLYAPRDFKCMWLGKWNGRRPHVF